MQQQQHIASQTDGQMDRHTHRASRYFCWTYLGSIYVLYAEFDVCRDSKNKMKNLYLPFLIDLMEMCLLRFCTSLPLPLLLLLLQPVLPLLVLLLLLLSLSILLASCSRRFPTLLSLPLADTEGRRQTTFRNAHCSRTVGQRSSGAEGHSSQATL